MKLPARAEKFRDFGGFPAILLNFRLTIRISSERAEMPPATADKPQNDAIFRRAFERRPAAEKIRSRFDCRRSRTLRKGILEHRIKAAPSRYSMKGDDLVSHLRREQAPENHSNGLNARGYISFAALRGSIRFFPRNSGRIA